jgi:predicted Fe-Mo cluster-binding NifX family protein
LVEIWIEYVFDTKKSRISPVFDSCSRVLLVDLEHYGETKRAEITFEDLPMLERLRILSKLGVTNVICAGISQSFHDKLTATKISLITGIVGEVDEVLSAFMCDGLNDPRFYMPGYKPVS